MTQAHSDFSETLIVRTRGRLLARALAVLLAAALLAALLRPALAADAAPDFVLKSATGANLRLSEYRGDVVALAFGASWCGECRAVAASLGRLQAELAPQGLQVLSVSFDDSPASGGTFPLLIDAAGETGRLYDVDELPLVVLVDRAGRLRQRFAAGHAVGEPALREALAPLLAE